MSRPCPLSPCAGVAGRVRKGRSLQKGLAVLGCVSCGGAYPAPELVPTVWELRDGVGGRRETFEGATCSACRASLLEEFYFSASGVCRVGFAGLDSFRREMLLAADGYSSAAGFPSARRRLV